MNFPTDSRIYISCIPGFEPLLTRECESLGIKVPSSIDKKQFKQGTLTGEERGGIEFTGSLEQLMCCNLQLRTASRVVVRLGEFYAAAFSELRKKASRLDWDPFLKPGQPVEVKVTCHKSKLYHSDAVAERIVGAIEDHFNKPIKKTKEDVQRQLILVRLVNDLCTISIDSSGELLHRRGYKQAVAKAPLRENIAAGLLMAAGWDGCSPLVDPFCGSGTIPIEAALISRHIAPGINRSFAFSNWPVYQSSDYQTLLNQAQKSIRSTTSLIYGSDRDHGAIEMASANAARTGVLKDIQFVCHSLSDLPSITDQGTIVTNPPYGIRVSSSKDLRNLYASFGKLLRDQFKGWRLGVLCNESQLIHALDLGQPETILPLINGGIPVKYSIFNIQ